MYWLGGLVLVVLRSLATACPDGFVMSSGRCYYVNPISLSRSAAAQECQSRGSKLVIIGSTAENSIVQTLMDTSEFTYWIGGTHTGETWEWDDGTLVSNWSNWGISQPNNDGNCMSCVRSSGNWYTRPCTELKPSICESGQLEPENTESRKTCAWKRGATGLLIHGSQSVITYALSRIQCASRCCNIPDCISFTYIKSSSTCWVNSETLGATGSSVLDAVFYVMKS